MVNPAADCIHFLQPQPPRDVPGVVHDGKDEEAEGKTHHQCNPVLEVNPDLEDVRHEEDDPAHDEVREDQELVVPQAVHCPVQVAGAPSAAEGEAGAPHREEGGEHDGAELEAEGGAGEGKVPELQQEGWRVVVRHRRRQLRERKARQHGGLARDRAVVPAVPIDLQLPDLNLLLGDAGDDLVLLEVEHDAQEVGTGSAGVVSASALAHPAT
mmetsp:Transcript_8309/g.18962  ORF Transcript_8309/g.18962 Transcript_8309/m.18962 type:complete len:212 (+) Transcript_8309:296-931(+)